MAARFLHTVGPLRTLTPTSTFVTLRNNLTFSRKHHPNIHPRVLKLRGIEPSRLYLQARQCKGETYPGPYKCHTTALHKLSWCIVLGKTIGKTRHHVRLPDNSKCAPPASARNIITRSIRQRRRGQLDPAHVDRSPTSRPSDPGRRRRSGEAVDWRRTIVDVWEGVCEGD